MRTNLHSLLIFLGFLILSSSCASFRPASVDFPSLESREGAYQAGGVVAVVTPVHPDTADSYFDKEDFYALPFRAYLLQVDNQSEETLHIKPFTLNGHAPAENVYKATRKNALLTLSTDLFGGLIIGYVAGFTPEVAVPLGLVSLGHFAHTAVVNQKRKKYFDAIAPVQMSISPQEAKELIFFLDSTDSESKTLALLTSSGKKHEITVPKHPFLQRNIEVNSTKGILVRPEESYKDVALAYGMTEQELYEMNDFDLKNIPPIQAGDTVYIVPKRTKARLLSHEVQLGETMQHISHRYAVDLAQLYYFNNMSEGQEPKAGELILMKGRPRVQPPALREQ